MPEMTCRDADEQLVSFLYGELPEDVRAAVRAHASTCARCHANLEGFEDVRTAVRSVLDEPPPARVRTAIRTAAAQSSAAAATAGAVAEAAAGVSEADRARAAPATSASRDGPSAGTSSSSWWDGVRAWVRGHWTLPTFATIGAIAFVLLGRRVLLDPERAYDRRPTRTAAGDVGEASPEAPTTTDVAVPAPTAPGHESPEKDGEGAAAAAVGRAPPADAPPRPARTRRRAGPAASGAVSPEASAGGSGRAEPPASRGAERVFAPPPTGWPREPRPAAVPAPASEVPRLERRAAAPGRLADAPAAEGAPRAPAKKSAVAPESLPEKREGEREDRARDTSVSSAKSRMPARPSMPDEVETSGGPDDAEAAAPLDALARRADRLFAEERWVEAVAAYRELLTRAPKHADAARWRQRLSLAIDRTRSDLP